MSADANARQARLKAWYEGLGSRDPELRAELEARSGELTETEVETGAPDGMALEAVGSFRSAASELSLETIVRTGRPALFVMNDAIQTDTPLNDPVSRVMVERVVTAKSVLDPWMPLIGRIDVLNHPAGLPFVGTGWLIQPGIVCTNRHVANLLGRQDGARYVFSRGRFDRPMTVTLNRRGEKDRAQAQPGDASPILEILWIEPDSGPDVALLRVGPPANGLTPTHLTLSGDDGREGQFITTIGYPARAYADTIPNQTWMDTIYGGVYDIKRAAPGELFAPKDGSSTYDCTTLGGASGSPVLDPATGKVLALHFAGLYEVENYGVPASRLRKYIGPIPSITTGGEAPPVGPPSGGSSVPPATPPGVGVGVGVVLGVGHRTATVTIPITITVGIGEAVSARPASLDEAIAQLAAERRPGVLAVKPGYSLVDGRDVIVVAADPRDFDAVRAATPAVHAGHPVEVRYATIEEQLGLTAGFEVAEAAAAIVYDDGLRSGPDFSFDPIDEEMTVLAHVGPEQSFPVLKEFLAGARTSLVSSMYQFFAGHVADSVEARLKAGVNMRIVLDPLTRDPKVGEVKAGEFDRSETFKRWRDDHAFDNIYVRKGSGGLIDTSYHIKVTVRDGDAFWLSSGNWTRSSQPFPDPVTGRASGNREWHVVVENKTLSTVFASHIQADYAQCQALGATPEAPAEDAILVDVPDAFLAVESEAPPRTLPPLRVEGRVKVKPILTPDRRGRVYTDAVLALIRSAKHQLVFQNQYIKILKGTGGNLGELVDALVERSRAIEDVRVILRDGEVIDNVTELKRRGMDVTRCVRIIGNTHTKGIVVDGKRVLVGSQNWSGQALSTNRDASLMFDDARIAQYFLDAFEIDWARARTPSLVKPSKPVLRAEGAEPPPGYSRMTLAEYLER